MAEGQRRYVVRIYNLGQVVWGNNDVLADSAEEARNAAMRAFNTPLSAEDLASIADPEIRAAAEALERRCAATRASPYLNVEAKISRARTA